MLQSKSEVTEAVCSIGILITIKPDLSLEIRQQKVFKKLIKAEQKKGKVNVLARNGKFFTQEPHETKFLSKGGIFENER